MSGPVWFPPGGRRPGPVAGSGVAAFGEVSEVSPEVKAQDERLEAAIIRAISKLAGIPIKIQPDGWPPFGARMFDRRTVVAGVAPTAAYVQLVNFTVDQQTNGYLGAIGIGIDDPAERVNMRWRLDLPPRYQSSDWLEINQLQIVGFPRTGCIEVVHFPLQGGETVGLSCLYVGASTPVVYARLMGWSWLPRMYDPTSYRGRTE